MKKYFYSVLAAGMLLACSQEQLVDITDGESQIKVFKVEIPAVESRTVGGFEISSGAQANTLIYAMYENGSDVDEPLISDVVTDDADGKDDGIFTVKVPMAKNIEYDLLFLACNEENSAFILADDVKNTDLKKLQFNPNQIPNEDAYDAFVGCLKEQGVLDPNNVILKRPFAQVNAATTAEDLENVKKLQTEVTTSSLVITNVPKYYDVLSGNVSETHEQVTYTATDIMKCDNFAQLAYPNETITVDGESYYYLTMAYVLAGKEETSIHDATFEFNAGEKLLTKLEIVSLPIQANHRTNIVGELLTNNKNYIVKIDASFGGDINKIGVIDGKTYIRVKNAEEFNAAYAEVKYDMIIFDDDIDLTEISANPIYQISQDRDLTIDLNGKKLSATSSETGKNYNLFDVRGTLTVKNGSMEYEHEGDNMGWNNSTNLFNVTAGGVLNLEGVTAKNLGGSDMAFVAHLNNWGEVTLNVNNSTLESTYIPVRVFNSGNDMNNVTIKNTTLNGKYCFWVHNYTLVDFGNNQEKFDAHKALLNFDIFNIKGVQNNTFIFNNDKNAPVLYGFDDSVYFDQYGNPIWDGKSVDTSWYEDENTEFIINTPAQLAGLSKLVDEGYTFEGKTIKLGDDIDLYTMGDNGEAICFNPIGSYRNEKAFKGTFDGQNYTISNLSQNTWALNNGYAYGDLGLGLFGLVQDATIKDLVMDNANISGESAICGVVAATAYGDMTFENITVKNSNCADYQYYSGGIVGWASGDHQYINCNVDASTTVAAQWGDFDNSIGGVIGGVGANATILMKNCNVACRIDAYNDVTSSYQWYAYRRCGMLIGNTSKTVVVDGTTYADAPQLTCENVTVTYGEWANYTYCEFAGTSWPYVRVQEGVSTSAYSNPRYGHPIDADGKEVVDDNHTHNDGEDHHILCVFDQLYGGGQGVYGAATHEGVTIVYNNKKSED